MQKRTIIDKIEIDPQTGIVAVRMRKQVVDDDGSILSSDYHRTTIDPGIDHAAQMGVVNAHLVAIGFPVVKADDMGALNSAMLHLAQLRATKAQEAKARAPK
jgi:hypothetical protein